MKTAAELRIDPRAVEAMRRLTRAGMTDAWCTGLIKRVALLPTRHAEVMQETKTEARARRSRLGEKMRSLANDVKRDPEASQFHPGYGGVEGQEPRLLVGPLPFPMLSIAGWLEDCADILEAGTSTDAMTKVLESRRGLQDKSFVIRGVYNLIAHYQAQGLQLGIVKDTRAKNKETALLASALLDETITANDVSQARRKRRRPYHKK